MKRHLRSKIKIHQEKAKLSLEVNLRKKIVKADLGVIVTASKDVVAGSSPGRLEKCVWTGLLVLVDSQQIEKTIKNTVQKLFRNTTQKIHFKLRAFT